MTHRRPKMAKKKTIRTIPQERTPMREQDPRCARATSRRWTAATPEDEALREADRCLLCPDQPCVAAARSASTSRASSSRSPRRTCAAPTTSSPSTNLLPAVCGRVCPQETQCEGVCTVGESLEPVAIGRLERFVGDTRHRRGLGQHALHRAERPQGRHRRLGPGRHGLRRRHGQGRLRGHRLRGLPRARRRAQVRHPGLPPAQRGRSMPRSTSCASSASSSSATRSSGGCSPSSR